MSQPPKSIPGDTSRTAPVEVLRLDRQLCFSLYGAAQRIQRLYRPMLDALGLTYPQYLAMLALWEKSPRTVGEMGDALDLDSSTLTPLLKRLQAAGLIARDRDPKDERRVIVTLTDKGLALRDQALSIPEQIFCLVGLPFDELVALRETLKTVAI